MQVVIHGNHLFLFLGQLFRQPPHAGRIRLVFQGNTVQELFSAVSQGNPGELDQSNIGEHRTKKSETNGISSELQRRGGDE